MEDWISIATLEKYILKALAMLDGLLMGYSGKVWIN